MIEHIATIMAILSLAYSTAWVSAITAPPATALSVAMTLSCFLGFADDRLRWRVIILAAALFALSLGLTTPLEIAAVIAVMALEYFLRTNFFLRRRFAGLLTVSTSWAIGLLLLFVVRALEGVDPVLQEPRRFIVANIWLVLATSFVVLTARRIQAIFYRPTL